MQSIWIYWPLLQSPFPPAETIPPFGAIGHFIGSNQKHMCSGIALHQPGQALSYLWPAAIGLKTSGHVGDQGDIGGNTGFGIPGLKTKDLLTLVLQHQR